jgi:hypothetical protein
MSGSAKGSSIVLGWISLGRSQMWQLDVYITALNTIEAHFAGGCMATEGIMDVFRARDTDLNEKYLHLVEGGYLWAGLDQGSRYFDELPEGVPPELVIEAPAELSDSELLDRIAQLSDDIDSGAAGTQAFTAWVRQVVELSDEPGQTGMFAESRALLTFELQDLYRDPAAKLDPAGVAGVCDSMDRRARGLHAARIMNGRTAAGMAGIAALTRTLMSAEDDDSTAAAGRALTFVALLPPGSDPAACLSALVGHCLEDGSADGIEPLAGTFRAAGLALLHQGLDSTDPSGDEFIESLHAAALEFEACFLLARSVLEAPGEHRPPGTEAAWQQTLDVAEEYTTRVLSALLGMAMDTAGEQTQTLMRQIGRIRREQGAEAACEYARSLVEMEHRYPRTALPWLIEAATGAPKGPSDA